MDELSVSTGHEDTGPGAEVGRWRAGVVLDFARSELFDRTFREGMELVEETASYLDGPGRQESKALNRVAALGYASESMRLTTRLMQVASWLLVQRAVREGDMEPAQAVATAALSPGRAKPWPRTRSRTAAPTLLADAAWWTFWSRSERLYERVMHLDRRMYQEAAEAPEPHPVLSQMEKLWPRSG